MNPQDDPEARIRALEQPLNDMARTSELGGSPHYGYVPPPPGAYPPPPPTVPYPEAVTTPGPGRAGVVVPVVIAVVALVVAGIVTYFLVDRSAAPAFTGGGGTLTERPPDIPEVPAPGRAQPGSSIEAAPPGAITNIAGIAQNKTLTCNDDVVNVSGFDNTVVLLGRCASVSVSGKDNVVTIDASTMIGVSGFDNRIVFHTGDPAITNSGFGNTVDRG